MKSLSEKVAIVTGGGSGIGEGLCRELAAGALGWLSPTSTPARPSGWPCPSPASAGRPRPARSTYPGRSRSPAWPKRRSPRTAGWTTCSTTLALPSGGTAQVILDGVARNKALIVFPASIRWGRRLDRLLPGLSERILLRQMRESRRYRTADEQVPR